MLAEAAPELVTVVVPVVFSAAAMDGSGKPSAGSVAAREELASAVLAEAAVVAVAGVVAIVVSAAGAMSAVVAVVGATAGFSSVEGCVVAAVTFSSEAIGGGAASSWSPEVVARVLARVKVAAVHRRHQPPDEPLDQERQ